MPEVGEGPSWRAGLVLALTGLVLVPLALALVRRLVPRHGAFFARWGFSHVLLLLATGVLLAPLLGLVVPGEGDLAALLRSALLLGTLALGAGLLARRLHPEELGALGLARGGNLRVAAAGLVAFVLVLPVLQGLGWLWPELARVLELEGGRQPVLDGILALEGAELALAVLIAVFLGPLFEEVVFRGFLQPLLVQNFRESGGIAITAFLFAILHGTHALLPLFGLSLLLGWLQLQTRRLAAPFAVHSFNNALTLGLAFAAAPGP